MAEEPRDWYDRLTKAERAVLEAYAEFHSYAAAAKALGKSESVVDQQLLSARRKMNVSSTAEAMFLLATRRSEGLSQHKIELIARPQEAQPDGATPSPTGSRQPANKSRNYLGIGTALVGITILYVALAGLKGPASRRPQSSLLSPTRTIAAEIIALHQQPTKDADAKARNRAELVGALCDQLWRDKWGAEEDDDWKHVLPDLMNDIYDSFEWATVHDPDLAVRIIGNGHRMLKLVWGAQGKWNGMVSQALALHGISKNAEFGRLECAFVFSELCNPSRTRADLRKGFNLANDAKTIFRTLGMQSDEANAVRHMGMCCAYWDKPGALELYRSALKEYKLLHDDRGMAQVLLSIAQRGLVSKSLESREAIGLDVLNAIAACRETGSSEMLGEAWDEMLYFSEFPSQCSDVLTGYRREMRLRAEAERKDHNAAASLLSMSEAVQIDVKIGNRQFLATDLEDILTDTRSFPFDSRSRLRMRGFYYSLCEKLHRPKMGSIIRVDTGEAGEFRIGQRLRVNEVPAVLRKVND